MMKISQSAVENKIVDIKNIVRDKEVLNYIENNFDDNRFSDILFQMIDKKEMKDVDVYKTAGIDRQLFSKIKSNPYYTTNKITIIKLGLAMKLDEEEFQMLLISAGYSLSKNSYVDILVLFCISSNYQKYQEVRNYIDLIK
ncbi:hypothetical protein [Acholeplasma palmae]|nr:hypothetical protein [Alteracholeplasma palmae]